MTKLPEPAHCCCLREPIYTKAKMIQFRRDLLEEAAKVADATVCDTHIPTGVKIYGQRAGKAIRALLKETNDPAT
jgi:hypothetical protein